MFVTVYVILFMQCVYLFLGLTFPEGESDEPYDMQFCKWMIKEKVKILVTLYIFRCMVT